MRPVTVRLPAELHRRVEALARLDERSVSKWVALATRAEVERREAARDRGDAA